MSGGHLFGRMGEDHRPVLTADVRTLAVDLGGIVKLEKFAHQLFIPDLGRIIGDLDGLGMAGPPGGYGFVVGRFGRAAEFADLGCFLLSSRASYLTGTAINLDGGLSPSV